MTNISKPRMRGEAMITAYDVGHRTFKVRWPKDRGADIQIWPDYGKHVTLPGDDDCWIAEFSDMPAFNYKVWVEPDIENGIPGTRELYVCAPL